MWPKQYSTMGLSQLLVFCAEKVSVDSMQMTAMAIATGVHTLTHQRQPACDGGDEGIELQKKTGRINLNFQQNTIADLFAIYSAW
jgi:hypothetical protein